MPALSKLPLLFSAALLVLAACALPRNVAIESEILATQDDADRDIAVVPVTKENLDKVSSWPASGGVSQPGWIDSGRGPDTGAISAGDVISLSIWDSGENSLIAAPGQKAVQIVNLPVAPDGSVFVPYLGDIAVNGLTHDQARELVQTQMESILPSVQVLMEVKQGRRNSVDVVGGLARVASYPLPDRNFALSSLISVAGGVDPALRNPQVRLVRNGQTYGIALERLLSDAALDVSLRGGDSLRVESDKRYFLSLGAAGKQSVQNFDREQISAMDAFSMIGGLVDAEANPKGVLILREYPAKAVRSDGRGPDRARAVFTLDLTTADGLFSARKFQIQPKDLVLVTGSPVKGLRTILGLFSSSLSIAKQVQ